MAPLLELIMFELKVKWFASEVSVTLIILEGFLDHIVLMDGLSVLISPNTAFSILETQPRGNGEHFLK
jgi:hypothetical protein